MAKCIDADLNFPQDKPTSFRAERAGVIMSNRNAPGSGGFDRLYQEMCSPKGLCDKLSQRAFFIKKQP